MALNTDELKAKVLDLAIRGKLVDSSKFTGETGTQLVERIKAERDQLIRNKKIKKPKKLNPISEDETPFDIPDNWTWVRLSEIASLKSGGNYKEMTLSDKGDYLYIKVGDMNLLENSVEITTSSNFTNTYMQQYLIKSNSIIFPKRGGAISTNKKRIVKKEIYIDTNTMAVTPFIKDSFDFFNIWFMSINLWDLNTGTAVPQINNKDIEPLLIPIPSIDEQIEIVKKVKKLIDIIDNLSSEAKSQLKTLDQLRQKTLDLAIRGKLVPQDGEDEPASELLKRIQAERDQLIKEKKIKKPKKLDPISEEEIPFEIPDSWEWIRLGDYIYNNGQKKPDELFSYIDVSAINNKLGVIKDDFETVKPEKAPSRARKIVTNGSVIYSTVRPYLLNIAVINKSFEHEPIVSTAFSVMNMFCGCSNWYLYYYLRSNAFIEYVESKMVGQAYPAINDSNLLNGLIPVPPVQEQTRIIERITSISSLIEMFEIEISKKIEVLIEVHSF